MIGYGVAVGDEAVFAERAGRGLAEHASGESLRLENRGWTDLSSAWDDICDGALAHGLDVLVLLREDCELLDPAVDQVAAAALDDPRVAVVELVGPDPADRSPGARALALGRWAIENLRVADADGRPEDVLVAAARAAGYRVVERALGVHPAPPRRPHRARRPLVSVLIPVFERAELLAAALDSVCAQTYDELDIVVVDNGSTDGTAGVARSYAARDSRIRVAVNPRNLGVPVNFGRAFALARGQYVKFLMSDDLLAPEAVETLAAPLADPTIMLSTSKRDVIDDHGNRLPDLPATSALAAAPVTADGFELGDLVLQHNLNVVGEPTTVMFRRADVDLHAPFAVGDHVWRTNGDVALWLSLMSRGNVWYDPTPRSFLRMHAGQDQHDPQVHLVGVQEWFRLIRFGRSLGFLRDRGRHHQALRTFVAQAAGTGVVPADGPSSRELWLAVAEAVADLTEA